MHLLIAVIGYNCAEMEIYVFRYVCIYGHVFCYVENRPPKYLNGQILKNTESIFIICGPMIDNTIMYDQGSTGAPALAEKALPGPAPAKIGQITGDLTGDLHFGVLFLNCNIYLKTINI